MEKSVSFVDLELDTKKGDVDTTAYKEVHELKNVLREGKKALQLLRKNLRKRGFLVSQVEFKTDAAGFLGMMPPIMNLPRYELFVAIKGSDNLCVCRISYNPNSQEAHLRFNDVNVGVLGDSYAVLVLNIVEEDRKILLKNGLNLQEIDHRFGNFINKWNKKVTETTLKNKSAVSYRRLTFRRLFSELRKSDVK